MSKNGTRQMKAMVLSAVLVTAALASFPSMAQSRADAAEL